MAAGKYDAGRSAFARGQVDWTSADIRAVLVGAGYTADFAAHATLADIPAPLRLASVAVPGRAVAAGWLTSDPFTFPAVPGGQGATGGVIFHVFGGPLLFCKQPPAVTPNGGDVVYSPPAPGIARL